MNKVSAIASLLLLCAAAVTGAPVARAGNDARISARIEAGGKACKNAIAAKYPQATMAEISVELGATLRQSIDAGSTTLKDIETNGLSYNWTFKQRSGYCNTDGSGTVTELQKAKAQ